MPTRVVAGGSAAVVTVATNRHPMPNNRCSFMRLPPVSAPCGSSGSTFFRSCRSRGCS